MSKKREKNKKSFICIDCDEETTDYYRISTNKGYITKCAKCYELWMSRMVRSNSIIQNPHSRNSNLEYDD